MSVETSAERHLDKARDAITETVVQLSLIYVDKCDGWDETGWDIEELFVEAIRLRSAMGKRKRFGWDE